MGINIINALLLERHGYIQRGLHERAAMVNDVLRGLGYVEKDSDTVEVASVEPATEHAAKRRTKKRTA
jgi:hypothetical protein